MTLSAAALSVAGNPRLGAADPSGAGDIARSAGAAAQALIESVPDSSRARLLFELGDANIEYDNVQNGANHVHTVYRDPHNDFGSDDLRRHWRESHIVR